MGPVLCAGLTAYKVCPCVSLGVIMFRLYEQAVRNTGIRPGNWLAVIGAGGGLGHFAGKKLWTRSSKLG